MPEYKYKAICHTACYWRENLWTPGEVYEGDLEPNHHFSADGLRNPELPPPDHGADPMPTETIRKILKNKYHSTKPRNWSRKQLWRTLKDCEAAAERDALTAEAEEREFIALCGLKAQSNAGMKSHQRNCKKCQALGG